MLYLIRKNFITTETLLNFFLFLEENIIKIPTFSAKDFKIIIQIIEILRNFFISYSEIGIQTIEILREFFISQ